MEDKDEAQKRLEKVVDVLDIIHVSGYVWSAGRALLGNNESAVESFARDRLLRILQGEAMGVIRGIRRMATERKLEGQKLKDVVKACNYLENNLHRMHYDEYLASITICPFLCIGRDRGGTITGTSSAIVSLKVGRKTSIGELRVCLVDWAKWIWLANAISFQELRHGRRSGCPRG